MTYIKIDIEDYLDEIPDDVILEEAVDRGLFPESLKHLNPDLMIKIYDYLGENCHTYDQIIQLERKIEIS